MNTFNLMQGRECLLSLCDIIISNKAYLSEVDGAIGDGDHGINMAKGFSICKETITGAETPVHLSQGFSTLANILMGSIGGSMGPLYGSIFYGMAEAIGKHKEMNAMLFAEMLNSGLRSLQEISDARKGDKCLMDTLIPAAETAGSTARDGAPLQEVLTATSRAAENGRDSTRDLVARIGRASRLGERSRGVLDAGSVSCCLIICTLSGFIGNNLS